MEFSLAVKPSDIIYGVDDKPSLGVSLVLGFQHICLISIALTFPVLVVRHAGGTADQAERMVAASMIAAGIGVIIQAFRKGPVGSGYLCPQLCGPSYLAASLLAVKTGGLSLLLGMTVFAGVCESLFSRVIKRLSFMFPAEVTGLIVTMVGISVVKMAAQNFFGIGHASALPDYKALAVAAMTLSVMVGLNVWSKGKLKLYCILIGMAFGYVLSWIFGVFGKKELFEISSAPFLSFPLMDHPGFSFDIALVIPFAVAMLCSSLKSIGDLTTCQKSNDAKWKRPDMKNVSKGILADGLGAVSAGLLGGFGQSTSSSNIGLTIANGATSRVIAFAIGGILFAVAFCPKISTAFAVMPAPVIGATLIFAISFMVVAGIQIILSRMLDARKVFVVGLSIIFGLSVDTVPQAYSGAHPWIQPIFSSSLSAATVMAVILNLIFRIGISKKAKLTLTKGENFSEKIFAFMDRQGGLVGMRKEVVGKAESAVNELMEAATAMGLNEEPIIVNATFDEYRLDIDVRYKGKPMDLPSKWPSQEELIEDKAAVSQLALLLMNKYADKVKIHPKGAFTHIQLYFEH
jgi:NCS2 family nucleobase:cation symporter-2